MPKIGIFYEFVKGGRKQTAEVAVEAASPAAAENKFKNQFAGRFTRVISTREIKKPPRV